MGARAGEKSGVRTLCTQCKHRLNGNVHALKSVLLNICKGWSRMPAAGSSATPSCRGHTNIFFLSAYKSGYRKGLLHPF